MRENSIETDFNHCVLLINKIDGNQDYRISYEEFKRTLVTKENINLARNVDFRRQRRMNKGDQLNTDVEFAIARVFEREILAMKSMQPFKEKLIARPDV